MSEAEFRLMCSRRSRAVLTGLACAGGGTLGWIALIIALKLKGVLFILPVLPLLLVPLVIAERRAAEWTAPCPNCGHDLLQRGDFVLESRTCAQCSTRVLEGGRLRRPDVWVRVRSIRQLQFLRIWLWAWPAMFLTTAVAYSFAPTLLRH